MNFKVGDIVEIHSLADHHARYNGAEGAITKFVCAGEKLLYEGRLYTVPFDGCLIDLSDETVCALLRNIRHPRRGTSQSATQIWNDLIHRLTEGVPA